MVQHSNCLRRLSTTIDLAEEFRLVYIYIYMYFVRFAIPHQPVKRNPVAQSLGRLVARSIARSIALSLDRSVARTLVFSGARSIARSLGCSVDRSVVRSLGRLIARSLVPWVFSLKAVVFFPSKVALKKHKRKELSKSVPIQKQRHLCLIVCSWFLPGFNKDW